MNPYEPKEYEYLCALWNAVEPRARLLDFLYSQNDDQKFTAEAMIDLEVDNHLRRYLQIY